MLPVTCTVVSADFAKKCNNDYSQKCYRIAVESQKLKSIGLVLQVMVELNIRLITTINLFIIIIVTVVSMQFVTKKQQSGFSALVKLKNYHTLTRYWYRNELNTNS